MTSTTSVAIQAAIAWLDGQEREGGKKGRVEEKREIEKGRKEVKKGGRREEGRREGGREGGREDGWMEGERENRRE